MAADFSNLRNQDVQGTPVVPLELFQVEGCPTLYVKPAAECNKPFLSATLRRVRANQGRRPSPAMIKAIRDEDRILYSRHVLERRWDGVLDSAGQVPEPSEENQLAFLKALPDHVFDEIRVFCGNLQNFLDEGVSEASELGKG